MPMRLHITTEGETEERFVKEILAPHLGERAVWADARRVLTSRDKSLCIEYRGGFRLTSAYMVAKRDICTWMKEDRNPDVRFTTMFDLYALPKDFPGYDAARREADPYRRVAILEEALAADITREMDGDPRFIPYIQLHEFEALILADPQQLDWEFLEHDDAIQRLVDMVAAEGGNPELIDDGEHTAPSKRIIAEIAEYEARKVSSGPLVVRQIGMAVLCERCRHFAQWIERIEGIGNGLDA
jgi:hypothetical protein